MKDFISALFTESGFQSESPREQIRFYRKTVPEKVEYYLVLFINATELNTFENEALKNIQEIFQEKRKEVRDVHKNTSLIICVEFSSYAQDCVRYQNQMLRIEEDDYSFKKYLLPYTNSAIASLGKQSSLVEFLNKTVSNEELFREFTERIYTNETYFFTVQCFLKLPFLNLKIERGQQFVTIYQLLEQKISTSELAFLNEVLIPFQVDIFQRDQLLHQVLDPNDRTFETFLNSFFENASDT